MNKEQLGFIEGIECRFVKTDSSMIESIIKKTGLKEHDQLIKKCLRYNIFTVAQFCFLSGLTTAHVHNMTKPSIINSRVGTKLDYCYPFPDDYGPGPKFIVRNEKSENYFKN